MTRGLSILVALGIAFTSARAESLQLPQLLELAARESGAAVQSEASDLASSAQVDLARSAWWPTIEVVARYVARDNQIEVTDPDGAFRFPTTNQYNAEYSVTARQLLFDGGQRAKRIVVARLGEQATEFAGTARVREQQLAALDAYLNAVTSSERIQVLRQRADALADLRRTVSDLYDQGLVARNDLLQTEVRSREIDNAELAAQDAAHIAILALERELGRSPDGGLAVPDTLAVLDNDRLQASIPTNDGVTANSQWLAAQARERASEASVELARRERWPSLVAEASHGWQQNDYLVYEQLNQVWAGLTWEIFDGGRRRAKRERALAERTSAHRDRVEVERQLQVQRANLQAALVRAAREEHTAVLDVAAAAENYRILSDQYQQGLIRSAELLDAEALLSERQLSALGTRAQHYRVAAALAVLSGSDPSNVFASVLADGGVQ